MGKQNVFFMSLYMLIYIPSAASTLDPLLACENVLLSDDHSRGVAVQNIDYSIMSPHMTSLPLVLDPCSHRMVSKLRINWNVSLPLGTSSTAGDKFIVCVNIHQQMTFTSSCFNLSLDGIQGDSQMHCLLDISGLQHNFLANIYVTMKKGDVQRYYFNELSTSGIDYRKTCKYVCDRSHPNLRTAYHCLIPWTVRVDNSTLVKSIELTDDTNGIFDVPFTIKSISELLLTIPNVTSGAYQLEVLTYHSKSGIFCSYTKTIHVTCGDELYVPTTTGIPTDGKDFEDFLIFACIASVVIFVLSISLTLGLYQLRKMHICKKQPRLEEEAKPFKPKRKLSLPFLHPHNPFRHNLPPVNKHFVDIINDINEFGPVPGRATSQELTERPTFLFVPIPYDSFTVQIMNCIRPILTQEGRFTSQCVFDDCIYINDDQRRFSWVESVIHDKNQIIVFMCFTSPSSTRRERTLADELLEQFLRTRIRPQCSAFLVLVTDEDRSHVLGQTYHGSIIHMMQKNEYERLLREVFRLCGLTFNAGNDNRLQSIMRSRESVHFLTMIGHAHHH